MWQDSTALTYGINKTHTVKNIPLLLNGRVWVKSERACWGNLEMCHTITRPQQTHTVAVNYCIIAVEEAYSCSTQHTVWDNWATFQVDKLTKLSAHLSHKIIMTPFWWWLHIVHAVDYLTFLLLKENKQTNKTAISPLPLEASLPQIAVLPDHQQLLSDALIIGCGCSALVCQRGGMVSR